MRTLVYDFVTAFKNMHDTLIFCEADLDQILILRMILIRFEAMSGLKINLGMSEFVPVGVVHNIDLFLVVLGCK